jgi:hypothetical protein
MAWSDAARRAAAMARSLKKDINRAKLGLSRVRGARRTGYKEEIASLEKELHHWKKS